MRTALRVALLSYRGNPRSGGQGIYVRNLSAALARRGHDVEVLAGPPYPELEEVPGVRLTRVPSLDLYREPDPFRLPGLRELAGPVEMLEFLDMCTAGFPEPLTFSLRVARIFAGRMRRGEPLPDIVHDNQGLGYGLLDVVRRGLPVIATIHHPVTVDRDLAVAAARGWQRLTLRRWYGFVGMQRRVARRLPRLVTVSHAAAADIADAFGVRPGRLSVVPVGVDPTVFAPRPALARRPGRLVTVTSADNPLKGLVPLLEAVAKLRVERSVELVVVGRRGPTADAAVRRLGLEGAVAFRPALPTAELVAAFAEAEVAVVPSVYEGFSLPAVEAMACGVALVATTGGALPEVVGTDGRAGLLVPPADPDALAGALGRLLDAPVLRARMGAAGRERVSDRFSWDATAAGTVAVYRSLAGLGERTTTC